MLKRVVALLVLVTTFAADRVLLAQSLEQVPAPIEVRAAPASDKSGIDLRTLDGHVYIVPGGTVRVFGTSVPLGPTAAGKQIAIEVKKPGEGGIAKLKAPLDGLGAFATTFADTSGTGEYVVTASTADGKVSAKTTFLVITPSDLGDILDALNEALRDAQAEAAKAMEAATSAMVAKGPFTGDATVNKNLTFVTQSIRDFDARVKQASTTLGGLQEVAEKYPGGAKHLEPIITELTKGITEAGQMKAGIARANAELSRNNGLCDRIDAVTEVLGAVSLYFDFTGRLFNKVVQLATDKFLPDKIYNDAVPIEKRDNAAKFQLGESMKAMGAALTDGGSGVKDFFVQPQNLLLDATQYLTGLGFDKLCERFQGPVTGTFRVDATINGSQKFWGYTTKINGKFVLRYAKSQAKPGAAIELTGEIEGNGDFSAYEDLMAFNSFNRQFVIYRQLFQPVGFGAAGQEATDPLGKLARHATPAYFRVPITGKLVGDTLTFT
ncbi:MAG: hypothetical protein M3541_12055, partial [Acidobacteriota bacterium]|nr:hypothetical protein [Acidobacteriota bacterium]